MQKCRYSPGSLLFLGGVLDLEFLLFSPYVLDADDATAVEEAEYAAEVETANADALDEDSTAETPDTTQKV